MSVRRSVVLVFPRLVTGWLARPRLEIPLGLVCVGTPLARAGYRVRIIDQRCEPEWQSLLRRELEQEPVCVGVTSMTGPQIKHALEVTRFVKDHSDAPVVWGGIHPTALPEQTLGSEYIDIVVRGEGEETFLQLVQALDEGRPLAGVTGITFRESGGIRRTEDRAPLDLDEQPPPDYDLVDTKRYLRFISGVGHLNFFTSRGCPHRCSFCFTTCHNRQHWRGMRPELAIARITDFVRRHGVRGVTFVDNNFFTDVERGRQILDGLAAADLGIVISKIAIWIETLQRLGEADFALLERAGCRILTLAVESGSERIRALLAKPVDVAWLRELNRRLRNSPMVPHYLFMMGVPTETKSELADSVALSLELLRDNPKAQTFFNVYMPFPRTELFDVAVDQGLRVPQRLEDWIPFSYRGAPQGAPWISADVRRAVEMLDFCWFFVSSGHLRQPTERVHPVVVALSNLYAPLARKRIERLASRFPVEIKLAKALGLYARPD